MPREETKEGRQLDCRGLGVLASHMISRNPDESNDDQIRQRKIFLQSSGGKSVDVKFQPSPQLVDFLELYFSGRAEIAKIIKVSLAGWR